MLAFNSETDQKNEGVELDPQHQGDDGANGAVQLIVGVKLIDIGGKRQRSNNTKYGGRVLRRAKKC